MSKMRKTQKSEIDVLLALSKGPTQDFFFHRRKYLIYVYRQSELENATTRFCNILWIK